MSILDLYSLCRICMNDSGSYSNMFEERLMDESLLMEVVNDTCQLDIFCRDGLPHFLCCKCYTKITEFELFRRQAHEVNAVLLCLKDDTENKCSYPKDTEDQDSILDCNDHLEITMSPEFEDFNQTNRDTFEFTDSHSLATSLDSFEEGRDKRQALHGGVSSGTLDSARKSLTPMKHKAVRKTAERKSERRSIGASPGEKQASVSESAEERDDLLCCRPVRSSKRTKIKRIEMNQDVPDTVTSYLKSCRRSKQKALQELAEKCDPDPFDGLTVGRAAKGSRRKKKRVKKSMANKELFLCDICGKGFAVLSSLRTHLRIHTGDRPFQCDVCQKSFSQKVVLKCHKLTHTGDRPYMCHVCGKRFSHPSSLHRHKMTHTGEKRHQCHLCDKGFAGKTELRLHVQTHARKTTYACDFCRKTFSNERHLVMHLLTHEEMGQCGGVSSPSGLEPSGNPGKSVEHSKDLKSSENNTEILQPTKSLTVPSNISSKSTDSDLTNPRNDLKTCKDSTERSVHKCDVCEMSFPTNSDLQLHRFAHAGGNLHQPLLEQPMFSSASLKVEVKPFRSDVLGPSLDHNNKSFEQALSSRLDMPESTNPGDKLPEISQVEHKPHVSDVLEYLSLGSSRKSGAVEAKQRISPKLEQSVCLSSTHKPGESMQFEARSYVSEVLQQNLPLGSVIKAPREVGSMEESSRNAYSVCEAASLLRMGLKIEGVQVGEGSLRSDASERDLLPVPLSSTRDMVSLSDMMVKRDSLLPPTTTDFINNCPQAESTQPGDVGESVCTTVKDTSVVKQYKCEFCQKSFAFSWVFKAHQRTHTGESPFKCSICDSAFPEKFILQVHMAQHKPYGCDLCSRRFSCKASLVKHVKSRHSDGAVLKPRKKPAEKKYKCDTCRKSFSSENYLEVHKRAHKGLKPFECHVCGKMYSEYSAFCAHRMIHVSDKPHRCNQCDKSFPFPTLLKKHMRSHVKTHLLKTKRKKPEGGEEEEKKACHFCSKVFKRKENLEAHLRRHTGVKPYRCDLCELAFHDRNLLSRHKFMHARENGDCGHKCEVCGLAFQKMSHLNSHMVTHSGLKPYKCEFCDKAYSQSGSLTVHRRLHTGVRPYSCPFCDKTFRDHSSWRSHKGTHTKDKIYECDICQKSFARMDSVTTHKKLHSGVRPH